MRKVVIVLLLALICLVGVPLAVAASTGKSEALQGLVEAIKGIVQCYVEFLEYLAKGSGYEAPRFI
jgi:hypothetical protein